MSGGLIALKEIFEGGLTMAFDAHDELKRWKEELDNEVKELFDKMNLEPDPVKREAIDNDVYRMMFRLYIVKTYLMSYKEEN